MTRNISQAHPYQSIQPIFNEASTKITYVREGKGNRSDSDNTSAANSTETPPLII
jgi:hypothetical protein